MNTAALTMYLAKMPFEFFQWWYGSATINLLRLLRWFLSATAHLFSYKELFTTFFKPWKNEYRDGLVVTAVFIGAFFKTMIIIFDTILLGLLLFGELLIFLTWILLPLLVGVSFYGAVFN